ncbi:hypothetical protein N9051_02110 [Akkermansiaceae bacterium]|nr:hypothetical protein [Akkermansiaceae bacterium]
MITSRVGSDPPDFTFIQTIIGLDDINLSHQLQEPISLTSNSACQLRNLVR